MCSFLSLARSSSTGRILVDFDVVRIRPAWNPIVRIPDILRSLGGDPKEVGEDLRLMVQLKRFQIRLIEETVAFPQGFGYALDFYRHADS